MTRQLEMGGSGRWNRFAAGASHRQLNNPTSDGRLTRNTDTHGAVVGKQTGEDDLDEQRRVFVCWGLQSNSAGKKKKEEEEKGQEAWEEKAQRLTDSFYDDS